MHGIGSTEGCIASGKPCRAIRSAPDYTTTVGKCADRNNKGRRLMLHRPHYSRPPTSPATCFAAGIALGQQVAAAEFRYSSDFDICYLYRTEAAAPMCPSGWLTSSGSNVFSYVGGYADRTSPASASVCMVPRHRQQSLFTKTQAIVGPTSKNMLT